jgi:hypothetical protein
MSDLVAVQIRDAVAAYLTGLATTGARVFTGSPALYPLAPNALPAIKVLLGPETIQPTSMPAPRLLDHMRSVDVIACARKDVDVDAELGQINKEVFAVLAMPLAGPWKALTPASVVPQLDVSSEQPKGEWRIRYEAWYKTREGAPDVAV